MRYAVFSNRVYYASGGIRDFRKSFFFLSSAKRYADKLVVDASNGETFAHVADLVTMKAVYENGVAHSGNGFFS